MRIPVLAALLLNRIRNPGGGGGGTPAGARFQEDGTTLRRTEDGTVRVME